MIGTRIGLEGAPFRFFNVVQGSRARIASSSHTLQQSLPDFRSSAAARRTQPPGRARFRHSLPKKSHSPKPRELVSLRLPVYINHLGHDTPGIFDAWYTGPIGITVTW